MIAVKKLAPAKTYSSENEKNHKVLDLAANHFSELIYFIHKVIIGYEGA